MKKLIVIFALCLPALLAAQMTYVPDDNFEQALIDLGYDTAPLNDSVPTKNIDTVTYLDVSMLDIKDLTGIEDFLMLRLLLCYFNTLRNLDVSQNTALTYLDCEGNGLLSLDVTMNNALTELHCHKNELTSLNFSNNSVLKILWCEHNDIEDLDVSKSINLTYLNCEGNQLTNLDVSKNTALTVLDCDKNQITTLDVSTNTTLEWFDCSDNLLSSIDVSENTALESFRCYDNPNLYCIQVADSVKAANSLNFQKDEHAVWSEDCSLINSTEEETNTGNNITLSPNPARDYIEISDVVGEVKVFDVLGAEVLTHPLTPSREGEISRIDVSTLPKGVYFVSVGGKMYKFVKI